MGGWVDKSTSLGQLKERNALLDRPARDAEEVLSIGLGEAPVAFGDVRRDGYGCAVELICQEVETTLELAGEPGDLIGEIDPIGRADGLEVSEQLVSVHTREMLRNVTVYHGPPRGDRPETRQMKQPY